MKGNYRKKGVPQGSQPGFWDLEPGPSPAASPREGEAHFLNPSPEALTVGTQSLRSYLCGHGLGWVLQLRAFLERSNLAPFQSGFDSRGRHALHPVVLLGLVIYGIIVRRNSLRELERLSHSDVGAWWLCGGLQPDHSTIGNFLNRFSSILTQEYFMALTRQLVRELKIPLGAVAGDGTVLEAASSRFNALREEAARAALAEARESAASHPSESGQSAVEAAEQVLATVSERRRQSARKGNSRRPDRIKVCPKEPEAVFQPLKNGSVRPSYKPVVLSHESGLVLGQGLSGSEESAIFPDLISSHAQVMGAAPVRVLLDGAYHNHAVLGYCVEVGLDVLCAPGPGGGSGFKGAHKQFPKSRFRYDESGDRYLCPLGSELPRLKSGEHDGRRYVQYQGKSCGSCPARSQCTKSSTGRSVLRYEGDELKEAMTKVFEDVRARAAYRKRSSTVEPVFAELKEKQGLKRFRRRGLAGAALEFSLHCLAYNLRKALALKAKLLLLIVYDPQRRMVTGLGAILLLITARDDS